MYPLQKQNVFGEVLLVDPCQVVASFNRTASPDQVIIHELEPIQTTERAESGPLLWNRNHIEVVVHAEVVEARPVEENADGFGGLCGGYVVAVQRFQFVEETAVRPGSIFAVQGKTSKNEREYAPISIEKFFEFVISHKAG